MGFNRWFMGRWMLALAIAAGAASLRADPGDLKDLDKAVFEHLAEKASDSVNITLDGSLLKMAAGFLSSSGDEDTAKVRKIVEHLKSVTVRSYTFKTKGAYSKADVDLIRKQLQSPDWSKIVEAHSKEDGDNAEIYVLMANDKPQGLFIIAAEPLELTVVHILGTFDMNDLGALEDLGRSVKDKNKEDK